jgi:multidrug efflux pump subunit AcrA (membrane-fusion protein)
MTTVFKKAFILPLIVVVTLAMVILIVKTRPPAEHELLQYPTKTVEVIVARKLPFRSRVIAYGNVEPAILLKSRTEISGKISYVHPSLKKGASLAKDTVVLRIEPTTFEFSLEQSTAALAGSKSALRQLEVEEASTRRSLEIAELNLLTGQKELDRLLGIWEKRLIARTVVDAEQQKMLLLKQQVEDLQGRIESYASRKAATRAQIQQSRTQLDQSKDTLGRTEIRLPFDARIGTVSVEKGEYAAVGTVLFEALGTQAVEVNATLPVGQFYPLIRSLGLSALDLQNPEGLQSIISRMQLDAVVSLVGYESISATWQGELLRIGESIDPDRDTINLVVVVNNPYYGVIPGKRPPLLKGMYAAVEIIAPARDTLVLPRKAIHQGRVYVATENDSGTGHRLEIRRVNIVNTQGPLVVIGDGVAEGEKIIVTDVVPVLDGLPLALVSATAYANELAEEALGEPLEGDTK